MSFSNCVRRFAGDAGGVAAVELALIAPVLLLLMGLSVYTTETLTLDRKLTQAGRTLVDLAAQQSNIGAGSTSYTYSQILAAAALIVAPLDTAPLGMVLSEVQVTGAANGTVVWSKASGTGTALQPNSSVTLSASTGDWTGGPGYMLMGTVTYSFQPLGGVLGIGAISFSRTLTMAPYNNGSVACCS